jgi:hypothetical protein
MAESRRYLDEEFLIPLVLLEQYQGLLGQLAREDFSPLPSRMRNVLARCHRQLAEISRALRQSPEAIRLERAREDQAHDQDPR